MSVPKVSISPHAVICYLFHKSYTNSFSGISSEETDQLSMACCTTWRPPTYAAICAFIIYICN